MALTKIISTSSGVPKWIYFESTSVVTVLNALSDEGLTSTNIVRFNTASGTTYALACKQ